jgi:hypothetical protein
MPCRAVPHAAAACGCRCCAHSASSVAMIALRPMLPLALRAISAGIHFLSASRTAPGSISVPVTNPVMPAAEPFSTGQATAAARR